MYQKIQKFLIFPFIFLNVDISFHIKDILPKFSVVVFVLCYFENYIYKIHQMFPDFCHKIKTRA